ncbi:tetratricopeptide repeat protein [Streptomyces sp. CC224B]|uniref:tetratricopeptide repeat protein n=1 Tax=Streptomyces sp. CC224B TaxID=3044571 RepID=UPI0024A843F7|nr:tetratricopeptide repeat protein [Streptomyces sp. CC224B]
MAAQRAPNSRLRESIDAVGCTYEALAKDVRRIAAENGEITQTNKSAISHWVNGTRQPTGRTSQYLAEALTRRAGRIVTLAEIGLDTSGSNEQDEEADPVLAVTKLGRADVERHHFLAVATFTTAGVAMPLAYDHEATARMLRARTGTALVGAEDVDVVRQITAAFSAADERLGGGHGLTTVTAYLADTAAPMLRGRFTAEPLRRAAFGAIAELAYLAGWKHHDLGQEGAAQRYYQVGYRLACEADPHGHAAWMMRALAHQALSLNHHCIDLAEAALTQGVGHIDGQTEALLHITHARAYAATDEKPAAARALLAAEDALLRDDGPQPSYSRVSGPAAGTVASHTARTLTDLADHVGTEQQHRDALIRWDPVKYKRVHALTYADLGDSLAAQARADEAVAAWSQALTLMEGMTSDRTRKAIMSLRSTLAIYQRRKVPGAADLARRAREALA